MCGVAGIFSVDRAFPVTAREIERMCRTIVHRGPNDQGIYVGRGVGLGVRRLSIIDLIGGSQPVHNEDESVWAVFNGEIFNYRELRADLERLGHRFRSQGDTEVIPHLYEQFGVEFVQKLRGMFAIALYDQRQTRLLLVRDRLGKKPLVYACHRDRLLFASEMRALLEVEPELAEVDNSALLQHLEIGYIYDPHTAFKKIRKLPAGHILDCRDGQIRVSKFWDVPPFVEDQSKSEQEWLALLEKEIAAAVSMRLVADVPVGALLSGGVDSSVVVALMARASSEPVKTFSVVFENQEFDEGPHARKVAKRFGTVHHELTMQPDLPETLDRLTRLLEEPFGDSSMIPTYLIARLVREHVKVVLSGDGGDELFGGYDHYASYVRHSRYHILPAWAGKVFRRGIFPLLPYRMRGRRFLYNASQPFAEGYIDSISVLPRSREGQLFTRDFLAAAAQWESPESAYLRVYDQAPGKTALARLQYLDMKTYLASDILPKVDRMSMAASLETRSPLLDHVVVEQANRIPSRLKLSAQARKYLLKKLAVRLGVPSDAVYRPKRGFAIPLIHWFRGELKQQLVDILTDPRTLQRGYFERLGIERILNDHLRRGRDRSRELWVLLIFELWHRNFLEPLRRGTLSNCGWSDALQVSTPDEAPIGSAGGSAL